MKWSLICLAIVPMLAGAQSPDQLVLSQETQARGYWIDPSTDLMWAGKDNRKDVKWRDAVKYCQESRLAGYRDWRLPTIEELRGIYDRNAHSPGLVTGPNQRPFEYQIKGGIFLTGRQWSGSLRLDKSGKPVGFALYFDFINGPREFNYEDNGRFGSNYNKHALCVRRA